MNEQVRTYSQLKNDLERLKLSQFNIHLDEYIDATQSGDKSFTEAMKDLCDLELRVREARILQSCVKTANFPFQKTLEDFDFSFQPTLKKEQILGFKDMRFIDQAHNILFIGSPGVGKTHLSVSIGIEAAYNHRSTYFITCNDLLLRLKRAQLENRLEQKLKLYARYKLLIIDEVGFLPLDEESSKLFFQLISMRYEKHSTIITTNKPLSQWGQIFGDPVLANAILDRLLHHCSVIKIVGKSYRTKDVQKELVSDKSVTAR
ncbi:IS21-like element helper ATPase IstB [Anaerolactibacter massiliensis]|uniref:IS21-like element helper ATPase IstB n=1 Tax=Anaerolactibacter massiliensis TaxID=2044573 RepID=UPI000CFA53CE|nr:IS21-like element helper ATPase IstB [Anaerolactibacter massiliensis]